MSDSTKTLTILNLGQKILFKPPQNLLELLNASEVSINQSCGANGTCTTCRVIVSSNAALNPRTELEIERAEERNFAEHERLSCQIDLMDDIEIEIPF